MAAILSVIAVFAASICDLSTGVPNIALRYASIHPHFSHDFVIALHPAKENALRTRC
jgi:hypothetical protein